MQHTNADQIMSYRYTPTILLCVCLLPSSRAAEQTSTMNTISDILIRILYSLNSDDFKRFKRYLQRQGKIPWQKLENANVDETVDMIVQTYCEKKCVSVVSGILKEMHLNQLALDLEEGTQSGKLLLQNIMLSWLELMELMFTLQCQ